MLFTYTRRTNGQKTKEPITFHLICFLIVIKDTLCLPKILFVFEKLEENELYFIGQ